jgi:hypothetical protein
MNASNRTAWATSFPVKVRRNSSAYSTRQDSRITLGEKIATFARIQKKVANTTEEK